MMKAFIAAPAVSLALMVSLPTCGQVITMDSPATRVPIAATQDGGQAVNVDISVIPAAVTLAGGRGDQGWFTVVTDPRQKLYWWRFQTGTPAAARSTAGVDEFKRGCRVYAAPQNLVIFCTTARHLAVASSTRTYTSDEAIANLVRSEFDQRASKLDTGFDFFDHVFNLWTTLGPDFFVEPGRANGINQVALVSINRSATQWEVVVGGVNKAMAKLTFSPDFVLRETVRLP